MPIYNITETKPAILRWDYTVFAQSEEEAEESKMFWETYEKFTTFIKDRTNVSVLRHERAEADDMIARFF